MIFESIGIALGSLRSNKLRTFLSMLGIIIGVGAVIAIVSVGSGAQTEVTNQISQLGSNVIHITPGSGIGRDDRIASSAHTSFTPELAHHILASSPSVKNLIAQVQGSGRILYGDKDIRATLVGTEPLYQEINIYYPQAGRFLQVEDLELASNVMVLGSRLARDLFSDKDPLGQQVRVHYNNRVFLFTIVGVMERKGQGFAGNFDTQAYIPRTTHMQKLSNTRQVNSYFAQARSAQDSTDAVGQIEYFLTRHLGDERNFNLFSQDQILEVIEQVTGTLNIMLGGIAGISLLVGGIGIMNIMLVSVTERTREIGIRKALGARKRNILMQFLIEALALSSLGGLMGIGLGWLGAAAVARLGGWGLVLSHTSILLALGFAFLVGLFFGIYPAMKAANLDPVRALSYE